MTMDVETALRIVKEEARDLVAFGGFNHVNVARYHGGPHWSITLPPAGMTEDQERASLLEGLETAKRLLPEPKDRVSEIKPVDEVLEDVQAEPEFVTQLVQSRVKPRRGRPRKTAVQTRKIAKKK